MHLEDETYCHILCQAEGDLGVVRYRTLYKYVYYIEGKDTPLLYTDL